jgi:hypothetical protein
MSIKGAASCRNIEYLIAYGDADARRPFLRRTKDAEWQVLNRKVATGRVGAFDKATAFWIVCFVERH